jgi:hypothetical protein
MLSRESAEDIVLKVTKEHIEDISFRVEDINEYLSLFLRSDHHGTEGRLAGNDVDAVKSEPFADPRPKDYPDSVNQDPVFTGGQNITRILK